MKNGIGTPIGCRESIIMDMYGEKSGRITEKNLPYFHVEGSFGGNQDWFTNIVMHIGGCAAATACDCSIYFALYMGCSPLYPYDAHVLTKRGYVAFSQKMKPYIKPRMNGVREVSWFIDGFGKYIEDVGKETGESIYVGMEGFSGKRSYAEARAMIKGLIDRGLPVPYLLLRHRDTSVFKDYIWHWFLLVGYAEAGDDLLVRTATYGHSDTFSLKEMWDTGCEDKGGLVQFTDIRYNK